MATTIQKQSVHNSTLVGTLYSFNNSEQQPGILLLSGSDGGIPGSNAIPESFIEYIVKNGFVVFALAYFGVEHLPSNLEHIPLEYFKSAVMWLKSQPQVDPSRLGIVGQSRGGELALLLGSYFPDLFKVIVASSPCNMTCGGFPHPNRPAWIYKTNQLMAMNAKKIAHHANSAEDPYIVADIFAMREKMPEAQQSQIQVEKIKCPLLLLSGDKDAIWPSLFFCEHIIKRLNKHNWQFIKRHINYSNAGHGILGSYNGSIYHPTGKFWCKLGGTLEGNKAANLQSWIAIHEFLQITLNVNKTGHIEPIQLHFAPATPSQRTLLHGWFEQPHIKEWMHGKGLESTLKGLEKFFEGKSSTIYWVGYDKEIPFAFLITSPEGEDGTTLDFFICNLNYLGKGLAAPVIKEFLLSHFSHIKKVFIDPEVTNMRRFMYIKKLALK